ncbi:MAG: hydroxyacid dehydrogenase [Candidatus Kerfeldbacteria bacterium]|nr:hydroxyacid dehydrogenase [Candidatus Kerfeldbacteria bacterium]
MRQLASGRDRILFLEQQPWERPLSLPGTKGTITRSPLTANQVLRRLLQATTILSVFTHSKITAEVLRSAPHLRLIVTRTTGYDHINITAARARGVTVCNVPEYGTQTVAEHTLALLLAISRRIVDSVNRTRRGNFKYEDLHGFDLAGKTLGVIGTGRIGSQVIRYAQSLGMDVLAHSSVRDRRLARQLDFRYVALAPLLRAADVVSLHVPMTPKTKHLLNAAAFRYMKRGVVIINTARGGLIDTNALVKALKTKKVAAAGLDVLEHTAARRVLQSMPNVLLTPHNAFNSHEALERIMATTVRNIRAFQVGRPINVVDPKTG